MDMNPFIDPVAFAATDTGASAPVVMSVPVPEVMVALHRPLSKSRFRSYSVSACVSFTITNSAVGDLCAATVAIATTNPRARVPPCILML